MLHSNTKLEMAAAKGTRPPNAGKGRAKGVPNKMTGDLRAMVLTALDNAGGAEYLTRQAKKKNPAPFLALVGKCIPKDLNVNLKTNLAELLREARERYARRS